MLSRIVSLYSKIYTRLPLPVRRAARFIYGFIRSEEGEAEAVKAQADFYRPLGIIQENDLVFDIGANRGIYSAAFASLGARVVAVEPEPSSVKALCKRFSGSEKVTVVPKGVGERGGSLDLHISGSAVSSTFSDDFMKAEEKNFKTDYVGVVTVPIVTLDSLIAAHGLPKYCKIDVEGFERQVLSGLSKQIPFVSFEFHYALIGEALFCISLLGKRGYAFNFCMDNRMMLPDWVGEEELAGKLRELSSGGEANGAKLSGDIFAKSP